MSCKAKPFKSFIDIDDPLFSQAQIDMPVMIRKYCRNKGQSIPEDIGEISRCVYESLAMKFRYNIETLEELTNKKIELLYIVGGGAKNELLCQWTADVTGLQVFSGQTETT